MHANNCAAMKVRLNRTKKLMCGQIAKINFSIRQKHSVQKRKN